MIGHPKYKEGDIVKFRLQFHGTNIIKEGIIYIVDKYGIFADNSDVYYDIFNEEENILYKHFIEPLIVEKIGEETAPF